MPEWLQIGLFIVGGAALYAIGYEVTKMVLESIRTAGGSILRGEKLNLTGTWYAVWQTTVEGKANVNSEVVQIRHRGQRVTIENVEKSPENALGGYLWRGKCTIYENEHLVGYYLPREANVTSKGTMYFVLNRSGNFMTGKWVGCNYDYDFTWGFGVIAKDKAFALATMQRVQQLEHGLGANREVM